jgi:hypothetical protein
METKHLSTWCFPLNQEIRKMSLARVICDCLDDIEMLQPFVFLQPDQFANKRTNCRDPGRMSHPF